MGIICGLKGYIVMFEEDQGEAGMKKIVVMGIVCCFSIVSADNTIQGVVATIRNYGGMTVKVPPVQEATLSEGFYKLTGKTTGGEKANTGQTPWVLNAAITTDAPMKFKVGATDYSIEATGSPLRLRLKKNGSDVQQVKIIRIPKNDLPSSGKIIVGYIIQISPNGDVSLAAYHPITNTWIPIELYDLAFGAQP